MITAPIEQDRTTVRVGKLVIDFGPSNQQVAWRVAQDLTTPTATITVDGEPL